MKLDRLMFATACMALAAHGSVLAAAYQDKFVSGPSPQEVRTRIGPPPEICKRVTGPEACVAVFAWEEDENGKIGPWLFVGWWPAKDTECIDQATGKRPRDCAAADAVPILTQQAQMELMGSMARPPAGPPPK